MVLTVNAHNNNLAVESFPSFFQNWLIRQEQLYDALVAHLSDNEGNDINRDEKRDIDLIDRVISHYAEYYSVKSQLTREDVFSVLSPSWFTMYERTFLWIGGFKPGLAFKIAAKADLALELGQEQQMEQLREEVAGEEAMLTAEFGRVQELVAAAAVTRRGWMANGKVDDVAREMDRARAAMAALVECADRLRVETAMNVIGVLSSAQAMRLLAAAAKLQLTLRSWGLQRARRT